MESAAWRAVAGRRVGAIALVAVGAALFALHASVYRDWLVDDSGISFAYAIHLAEGHGLVSQVGAPPVEGYSNALWVFLLAAMSRAGFLALPLAPKVASGVFVVAAYATWIAILGRVARHPGLVAAAVLVATSLDPAVVIWCTSGLENALYVFTVTALLYATLRALDSTRPERAFAACGTVASLVAMTRPDGAIFALVPPVLALATRRASRRTLASYFGAFGSIFGAFLLYRVVVFHALVPNTAVAKGGPGLEQAIDLLLFSRDGVEKLDRLLAAAIPSPLTNVFLLAAVLAHRRLLGRGVAPRGLGALAAFAATSATAYMLMPADWMGEHRFATPFFPLYYAWAFVAIDAALDAVLPRRRRACFALVASAILLSALPVFAGRARAFATSSNISLFFVREAFAERFDRYARALRVEHPSVLLPDVGGMLLWSHARVYDLAGLCDREIARALAGDVESSREYILGTLRPTFIHTYGMYSRPALERDSRFENDYVPIHVYDRDEDPSREGHQTGIFVRKDALTAPDAEATLEAIRRESHNREDFVPPLNPSAVLRWLLRTPLVPKTYRERAPAIVGQGGQGGAHTSR